MHGRDKKYILNYSYFKPKLNTGLCSISMTQSFFIFLSDAQRSHFCVIEID